MPRRRPSIRDLLAAQVALWRARRRLRTERVGRLVRHETRDERPTGSATRAQALATAVNFAADHGLFHPFCLVRAMALTDLLTREGILGSDIHVGVRQRDGQFAAHAWVRWGDELLGDDPVHVATFTEVNDLRVLGAG